MQRQLALLLSALALLWFPELAAGRKHRSKGKAAAATAVESKASAGPQSPSDIEPPPAGEPGAPDYEALAKGLETAYRQAPNPELLYQLGTLAKLLGKSIEAQDFMRRYLADPLTQPSADGREEAERVASQPRPASGEVQVVADQEGLILVDNKVVGVLPLAVPLLVPVGQHVVALEMRDKTMKGRVKVLDGRGVEMRFSRESGAVVVTLPPSVIVLPEFAGTPPPPIEIQRRLTQVAEQAIQKARLAIYGKEAALRRAPKLAECLTTLQCLAQLAIRSEVDYVLPLRIERRALPAEYAMSMRLIDAEVEAVAATGQDGCSGCTSEQLTANLTGALQRLLKAGHGRPRGTLIVRSEPSGAEVKMGDQVLGRTPFDHAAFVGTYELTVQKQDYAPEMVRVTVQDGKKVKSEVALSFQEPAPAPLAVVAESSGRPSRPRWRLITGGVVLGVGLLMAGFGISGIAIDNQCVSDPVPPALRCRDRFDTLTIGAGLLGAGAGLSIAGAVMLAIPGRPSSSGTNTGSASATTSSSLYRPGALGLALSF